MRRILFALTVAWPACASAQSDDLSAAMTTCAAHRVTETRVGIQLEMNPYNPPWEHCWTIERAFKAQRKAQDEADETKTPELKSSRAVADKLLKDDHGR